MEGLNKAPDKDAYKEECRKKLRSGQRISNIESPTYDKQYPKIRDFRKKTPVEWKQWEQEFFKILFEKAKEINSNKKRAPPSATLGAPLDPPPQKLDLSESFNVEGEEKAADSNNDKNDAVVTEGNALETVIPGLKEDDGADEEEVLDESQEVPV
jgi:hypothetical protein